jgi:hypothetical protein
MIQVCPLCADADDVEMLPLDAGAIEYTCTRTGRHPGHSPYVWVGHREGSALLEDGREGPAFELGMLDDLLACVPADDPWLEYGIVERRYRDYQPDGGNS